MTSNFDDDAIVTRSAAVLSNPADGGVLMMDIDSGSYFAMDSSAAAIWTLIAEPRSVRHICAALQNRYAVDAQTCRDDVAAFLADLSNRGLVSIA